MTIELLEDQGHMTWKTVHQILHDDMGQEEDHAQSPLRTVLMEVLIPS
jgi:hypothetical protein